MRLAPGSRGLRLWWWHSWDSGRYKAWCSSKRHQRDIVQVEQIFDIEEAVHETFVEPICTGKIDGREILFNLGILVQKILPKVLQNVYDRTHRWVYDWANVRMKVARVRSQHDRTSGNRCCKRLRLPIYAAVLGPSWLHPRLQADPEWGFGSLAAKQSIRLSTTEIPSRAEGYIVAGSRLGLMYRPARVMLLSRHFVVVLLPRPLAALLPHRVLRWTPLQPVSLFVPSIVSQDLRARPFPALLRSLLVSIFVPGVVCRYMTERRPQTL